MKVKDMKCNDFKSCSVCPLVRRCIEDPLTIGNLTLKEIMDIIVKDMNKYMEVEVNND